MENVNICGADQSENEKLVNSSRQATKSPNFSNIFNDKSKLNKMAIAFYSEGKYEEAEKHYKLAISLDPNFKAAYNNLGNAQRK